MTINLVTTVLPHLNNRTGIKIKSGVKLITENGLMLNMNDGGI